MSGSLGNRLTERPLSPASVVVSESEGLSRVLTLAATYSGPDGTRGISAHSPLARTSHMAKAIPRAQVVRGCPAAGGGSWSPLLRADTLRVAVLGSVFQPCSDIIVFFWIPGEGS